MTGYNGHPSWAYWNVALWIGNDEGLYRLARLCVADSPTRRDAAQTFIKALTTDPPPHPRGGPVRYVVTPTTPDGAPYTVNAVIHAMRGLA